MIQTEVSTEGQPRSAENSSKVGLFLPLDQEIRTHVSTAVAAYHLDREPQTLRVWHCKQIGPKTMESRTINGRIHWSVAGIKKTLGVHA